MALSAAAHHSYDKVAAGEKYDGPLAQKTDRAGEAANQALRRQKSKADAVFFELFDEDTAGVRHGVLAEPTMEHIVDFVCCAARGADSRRFCAADGGTAARRAPVLRQAHDCSRAGFRSAQDSS